MAGTLFLLIGGDKQNAAELARLRGEMDAIEQTSIRKNCGISISEGAELADKCGATSAPVVYGLV